MTAHGASFQGCDLSQSSMWQLQAEAIDFSNAVLTDINMDYSNIRRVNFGNAVLTGTGLKHCIMEDCNLIGADLSQADFDDSTKMLGCTYDDTTLFPEAFDPLTHGLVDVNGPVLRTWPNCYDDDKNCDGVDYTLLTASMWHATLSDASFVDTNWQEVGFGGSHAQNADFTRANLRDASVNHVRFDNAILRETDLSGANFDSTRFTGADLTSATYSAETVFARASFDPTTKFPDGNTWLETNFFTTDIKGMKLILDDQDVSGMDLSSRFSSFSSCSFSRMTAHGASFQGCDLSQSSMWQLQAEAIDFSNAVLTDIHMDYSNFRRANFGNAVLTGTGLKHCNMEDCNLVGADLSQADFDESTNMLGCTYDDTTLFPEAFDPLTHGLVDVNRAWPNCYDEDKNCDGVDFTSAIDASMWHSTLSDASFVDTNWQE
eukprot:scaffold129345_cov65-Attheya_sp.AAC.1